MATILAPTKNHIDQAVTCVQTGGVIAYPTETVYGLGADPFNTNAVDRIFQIKGREASKGFILLIRGQQDLAALAADISPNAQKLMKAFWPGPLTLIFKAKRDLPPALLGGRDTVALRHSSAPIAQTLLNALKGPLTSTSANRSGEPPAQSAHEACKTLGDDVDLILEGPEIQDNRPSALVDASAPQITCLRPGRISEEDIQNVLEK